MPADYQVLIKDEPVTISKPGDPDTQPMSFSIPALAGGRQVLQFMVHTENANNLVAVAVVNDKEAWQYGPTDTGLTRPFHDTISNLRKSPPDPPNTIQFRIKSGTGTFRVSSLIVWYRVP
jgi:hypothetical protein